MFTVAWAASEEPDNYTRFVEVFFSRCTSSLLHSLRVRMLKTLIPSQAITVYVIFPSYLPPVTALPEDLLFVPWLSDLLPSLLSPVRLPQR
jgi:hypothetical protein